MSKTYSIPFHLSLLTSTKLLTIALPYGLYPNESTCKVCVPEAYVEKVKACANLWELQALYRKDVRQYLSTDNDLVDQQWLNSVGAIRHSATLWRIDLPLNWQDQIWVKLDIDNRIKDAYVAKARDNNYGLIDALLAHAGAVKQLYFDYCNQELKLRQS